MSFTITQVKDHLTAMGHGSTLNKVRNIESLFERAASVFLLKMHPLEVMRNSGLTNTVHDEIYNYSLPSDFGQIIDLIPQDNRNNWDNAVRTPSGQFDLQKAIKNKTISIEGSEGSKIIRINWRSRQGKTLNAMNDVDDNGTWSAVGTASGIVQDTIFKQSGGASVRFDLATTGDGIQNTTMTALDLTDEDEAADLFIPFYIKNSVDLAKLTSATFVWGNDLTTNYWTGVAQTAQADGTAFKVGWNLTKVPWSTATESGTVNPATIDSAKLTFAATGAISDIRVDNIIVSIGRNFDCKYYSKYLFKNSSGTWISKPSDDNDYVMIDNDTLPHFLYECLVEMAQQMEGSDSVFDISFAEKRLAQIYPIYKAIYPNQLKKQASGYGGRPGRGRW